MPADSESLSGSITSFDSYLLDEVLGHASIATTQMYTYINKSRRKAAVDSLPDVR
ncbi:hypothetical protein [Deinococcus hopiensis]|uniref:hypothetical protein n=1 Tax=Deinococcus hopiensis TaxID=309885 RepID=UPI001482C27F|nr:hypothetical protein [Deinococcus hopiensis]